MVGARNVKFGITVNLFMSSVLHLDISDNATVAVLRKFEGIDTKCKTIGKGAV
jgi:hypothetical protein